jgi:hypothetical protein
MRFPSELDETSTVTMISKKVTGTTDITASSAIVCTRLSGVPTNTNYFLAFVSTKK